jgi:hypothetical protein
MSRAGNAVRVQAVHLATLHQPGALSYPQSQLYCLLVMVQSKEVRAPLTRGFFIFQTSIGNNIRAQGGEMAKKAAKRRPWTKEDVRTLKTLAREKTKTTVIARKLKRSVGATRQKAMGLGVTLGTS